MSKQRVYVVIEWFVEGDATIHGVYSKFTGAWQKKLRVLKLSRPNSRSVYSDTISILEFKVKGEPRSLAELLKCSF